jgi:pseudouridine-5'-phosphate glycosidase
MTPPLTGLDSRFPELVIAEPVAAALAAKAPIVALETTVITHGLPAGEGVAAALELESIVRAAGATPATIGVLEGRVRVGLTSDEIEALVAPGTALKLNPGNLAAAIANGASGATTVAATMWMAHGAAIHTIATGGIGGVHRGESGDESADLVALARWPVAVVCSGVKAVLDLPRTRERLETLGVPVLGLMTPDLPAFYRRSSGLPVDHEFATVDEVGRAIDVHWRLGGAGVVVAHPVPAEDEMPRDLYESAITRAVEEAAARRLAGRGVTPFLLERMRELTGGKSLVVNRALLRANAAAAARLAASLAPRTDAFPPS